MKKGLSLKKKKGFAFPLNILAILGLTSCVAVHEVHDTYQYPSKNYQETKINLTNANYYSNPTHYSSADSGYYSRALQNKPADVDDILIRLETTRPSEYQIKTDVQYVIKRATLEGSKNRVYKFLITRIDSAPINNEDRLFYARLVLDNSPDYNQRRRVLEILRRRYEKLPRLGRERVGFANFIRHYDPTFRYETTPVYPELADRSYPEQKMGKKVERLDDWEMSRPEKTYKTLEFTEEKAKADRRLKEFEEEERRRKARRSEEERDEAARKIQNAWRDRQLKKSETERQRRERLCVEEKRSLEDAERRQVEEAKRRSLETYQLEETRRQSARRDKEREQLEEAKRRSLATFHAEEERRERLRGEQERENARRAQEISRREEEARENARRDEAARKIQNAWRAKKFNEDKAKTEDRLKAFEEEERRRSQAEARQDEAARKIQNAWKKHKEKVED